MLPTSRRRTADRVSCCTVPPALREHHDRLLRVDTDPDELLELLEFAVTWGELDYSGMPMLGPAHWLDFAEAHEWRMPVRAHRIFSLATDIAARSVTSAAAGSGAPRASLRALLAEAEAS